MTSPTPFELQEALCERLLAVSPLVLSAPLKASGGLSENVHDLLDAMVGAIQVRPDSARVWLLLCAMSGQFPQVHEVHAFRREIELLSIRDAKTSVLRWASSVMSLADAVSTIAIIDSGVVVDVDFASQNDLSSGIQRVARRLMSTWHGARDVTMVKFDDGHAFTGLSHEESQRMVGSEATATPRPGARLIPWGVPILIAEVPDPEHSRRLAALAEFSPNRVVVLGYDVIPIVSADLVAEVESQKFGEYLELVKHCAVVVGISQTAADEFSGYVATLPAQGLDGPEVITRGLPTHERIDSVVSRPNAGGMHEVLCVGTLDRRKNQFALVQAAELLWRHGIEFRLRLVGAGAAAPPELTRLVRRLKAAGRCISVERDVSDDVLQAAYRSARVVAFPTLHEGFGLPVVEALSFGVPVVTSAFGSTKEIGDGQGAVLIDPEDVESLAEAIRGVLTDDVRHRELVSLAAARPVRTWDDYATELWHVMVS